MILSSIKLTEDGDPVFPTQWITGMEALAQKVTVRLRTHLGEYILDRNVGIDWIGLRDGKLTDERLALIRAAVVAEVSNMDEVTVTGSAVSLAGRSVSISFSAIVSDTTSTEAVTAEFGVGGGVPDLLTLRRLIWGPHAT